MANTIESTTNAGLGVILAILVGLNGCEHQPWQTLVDTTNTTASEVPDEQTDTYAGTPTLIAPFTPEQAEAAQNAWSKKLKTPVELTNGIGMKLKLIPTGEYLMGSSDSDDSATDREKPQHRVRITQPFFLGVYEVSQAEYELIMEANPSLCSEGGNEADRVSGMDTSRFPVDNVSWEDAVEFCRKLSSLPEEQRLGRKYRLPTEAEWEYACRAGTETAYHFGSRLNGREANCDGRKPFGTEVKGPSLGRPTTAGSYAANALGLYDMHANVYEWCHDWYDKDYYRASPVDDPRGPPTADFRAFRGGCWDGEAYSCRAALRFRLPASFRSEFMGFRVVLTASSQ